MKTKIIKQAGIPILALSVVVALGACSSKPSPWSQQASPWDSREGVAETEPAPMDEMAAESPFVTDAAMAESSGIAEPSAFEVSEPMMEEPMLVEPMSEEPVVEEMMDPEPMMAETVAGNIGSQPPGYYAVQVVASSKLENLQAFASRHQISEDWVAETNVNGKTWFVLLQGIYATKDEAKMALDQVSVSLDTSPWIRSVGSLQSVMTQ